MIKTQGLAERLTKSIEQNGEYLREAKKAQNDYKNRHKGDKSMKITK